MRDGYPATDDDKPNRTGAHEMSDKLARALSGSRLVEYDEQTELVYAWNGSLTVNIYSVNGDPLDVFTFGKSDGRDVTLLYAEQQIQERMAVDRGEEEED